MTPELQMWVVARAWELASAQSGPRNPDSDIRRFKAYYWALVDAVSERTEAKKQ